MGHLPNNSDHSAVVRNSQGYKKLSKHEITVDNHSKHSSALFATRTPFLFPVTNLSSVRFHATSEISLVGKH